MGEDFDLLVKLRAAGVRVVAVDDTFVVRRFFGDNLTYALRANDSGLSRIPSDVTSPGNGRSRG